MAKSVKKRIGIFIGYFREQLDEIQNLESKRAELYREVLYVAVLDALSKSVMPFRENNQERFLSFLEAMACV